MADRTFIYDELGRGEQVLFPLEARSATNDVQVQTRNPNVAVLRFLFEDVPDVANRVIVRFKDPDTGLLLVPAVPVEGPDVKQTYLLGHRTVVPSGIVAKITGTTMGPGEVQTNYDLDVEVFDQLLGQEITGHTHLVPAHFVVEVFHDGTAAIRYEASITIGSQAKG